MIAVDWGGSRLRLYRLDADGRIRERRHADQGMQASRGRFGEVLSAQLAGWDDADVVLCGMIGARGGWHEMPYLECPAGLEDIAAGLQRFEPPGFDGRRLWLVPGLRDLSGTVPDVMRGEECQLAALLETLPAGSHRACLPGTHSKWVTIRDGHIERIHTAMTGELYDLLRRHSLVGELMTGEEHFDADAFDAGLERSGEPGGLPHHLFGVRAAGLAGLFDGGLASYLSGLLLGHEVRAGALAADAAAPDHVHLVGSERLLAAYERALSALGIGVQRHAEDLAARGLHAVWTRRAQAPPLTLPAAG